MENASGRAALSYLILHCLLWTVPSFSFFWKPYVCIGCEKCSISRSNLENQVGGVKMILTAHITFLYHSPSSVLPEQLCIFSKLVTSLICPTPLEAMSSPQINPVETSLHCKKLLCLRSVAYYSQSLRCYCHIAVFHLITEYYILTFQRNGRGLTDELPLLQRWLMVRSMICCFFTSTCKKVCKSFSSQNPPTQTSCCCQFDQLFYV